MKNFKIIAIIAGVIAILALIALAIVVFNKKTTLTDKTPVVSESKSDENYTYEYSLNRKDDEQIKSENSDGKIFKVNSLTNEKTLVVPSIKSLLPKTDSTTPYTFLNLLGTSKSKTNLYFSLAYTEGSQGLYKYDGNTNKLTELNISSYYDSFGVTTSPSGLFGASIYDPKDIKAVDKLFLLDLENDSVKTLATLPANQRFDICGIEGCLGTIGANIEWIDEFNFQINVYSAKAGKDENGNPKAILIEKRKFKIN